jgi:CCR4-NOT transcription complex subunit 4
MPATAEVVEEPPAPIEEPEPEVQNPVAASEPTVAETPRPQIDPILKEILRAINSPLLSFPPAASVDETPFPPLFDTNGGAKRRAMREQNQQEEARLNSIERESQADMRSVTEPVEEDEPESGSLQLGGEPEDRDGGREMPQFQRRPSTQLPIQRTNNGPGAPGLSNFPRNLSNLSSINGRVLTPQQTALLLNSNQNPSSFADQFSPGIGSQLGQSSGLFQQQGHNRQSSRYSFASENPSALSVKPSANPKLMAQQSAMMPNHSQGNQFYGSSMPGPPPGLKSTGTPPIGFGQNHGFGGSMGGASAFGGVPKGTENDMLQNILRGRGNVGGQSHDSGKRELNMFPTFLQQYPSASSTPAPSSGMASLYGSQPGAFVHDSYQKQKKKGKKHRHANTSSSGGGGLVDLADPSILQARMQHQQQSNAGVGQLFGTQAQGGYNSNMMYGGGGYPRW